MKAAELPDPLAGSTRDFLTRPEPDLAAKAVAFSRWHDARIGFGGFPYAKRLTGAPAPRTALRLLDGSLQEGLNFSSQDYLGLASHPAVKAAACTAVGSYGVHSAGSSALAGEMDLAGPVAAGLGELLRMPHVTLFPTGWAAGYGVVRGLVRETDHVVIDLLAHNCLMEGALAATRKVVPFLHLDVAHARQKLAGIREREPQAGILLVTESLFSMDADTPRIAAFQELAAEFGARLLVDVAHDLGCLGATGGGHLEQQGCLGRVDLVIGSFSKTFASNGGFVACRDRAVYDYLRYFAPPNTFSNALGPVQLAVVAEALRIVRSEEGDLRRAALLRAVHALRGGLVAHGVEVLGAASPIVPAHIGAAAVGRRAVKLCGERGVLVNLVEFPAVARNASRFRLQVMATHTPEECETAARVIADALAEAAAEARAGEGAAPV